MYTDANIAWKYFWFHKRAIEIIKFKKKNEIIIKTAIEIISKLKFCNICKGKNGR